MNNTTILSSLGNLTLCSDIVTDIELKNYLDKRIGGSISSDVEISGFLSVGENIAHGTSLTSGAGVGDSSGNPVEVEMSAVHGAAFNSSKAFGMSSFAANKGNAYAEYSAAFNDGTAYSSYSLAHGTKTSAFGYVSHVEGQYTQTGLPDEIGNDLSRQTYGAFSHAEGDSTSAIGLASHADGRHTITRADYSHTDGVRSESLSNDDYSYVWSGVNNEQANNYPSHGAGSFSINPKEGTNGFFIGDRSFADYLSEVGEDVNEQIARKLDKHDGGSVSGDVEVYNHDLRVLSGNYIQATDPTHVYNYSQKNTFIQAEEAFSGSGASYGPANTGSYGYCILSVVNGTNYHGLKLSGDISKLAALLDNNDVGAGINYDYSASKSLKVVLNDTTSISNALFSLTLGDQGETMMYQISSIDQANNIVYLKQEFSISIAELSSLTEAQCIDLWENDDNAFYVAGFPEIGNTVVKNFYAQHVEGGSSRAVGKYTHAEGRDNIADVRYAHAEGSHNIAANMASHAEGFYTYAAGRYSHSEGDTTKAIGKDSHAEGKLTQANGSCSHVEGEQCKTIPNYANEVECGYGHAEGYKSTAGYVAHAECWQTSALGSGSHAEGHLTLAYGKYSHAEGENTVTNNGSTHAEGYATSALYFTAHSEGYMSYAGQVGAHAEGGYYLKDNNHIQGGTCINASHGSHAEGLSTFVNGGIGAHAEGCGCTATGNGAHAEGGYWASNSVWEGTLASGKGSHSEGCMTVASGKGSHAGGLSSIASNDASFAHGRNAQATGNTAIAFGYNSTASKKLSYVNGENCYAISADYAFATGYHCNAEGMASRADGYYNEAKQKWDIALGVNASAKDQYTYVWSEIEKGSNYTNNYTSHGKGSFNVNPIDGLSGFYIGKDNFIQCVLSAVQMMSDTQKTALKNALGIA